MINLFRAEHKNAASTIIKELSGCNLVEDKDPTSLMSLNCLNTIMTRFYHNWVGANINIEFFGDTTDYWKYGEVLARRIKLIVSLDLEYYYIFDF